MLVVTGVAMIVAGIVQHDGHAAEAMAGATGEVTALGADGSPLVSVPFAASELCVSTIMVRG